ncbi:MAG: hypothetical protein CL608_23460, partial [Anaerolineaceae bacterium]|nr:hypothetical protein [Anaerolineaceae bacterium]
MKALNPEQFGAVRPLFTNLQQNLVVESVLSNMTRGRVYVDDPENPQLGLLWTEMDAVLLAGEPNEQLFPALRHLILDEMMPDARSRYIPHFTITVDRLAWVEKLPVLLPEQSLVALPRLAFHLVQPPPDWRALLPAPMTLQSMDAAFFARQALENLPSAAGWVRSFWPDIAAFEAR